jgi:hypothetical protein
MLALLGCLINGVRIHGGQYGMKIAAKRELENWKFVFDLREDRDRYIPVSDAIHTPKSGSTAEESRVRGGSEDSHNECAYAF